MNRVAEFLTARIGEDEAAASAVHGWWRAHGERAIADVSYAAVLIADVDPATRAHILRYDPARALREVEAKRTILAAHDPARHPADSRTARWCPVCITARTGHAEEWDDDTYPCKTLRALASVYSDHPDYRQGWRP